MPVAVLQVKRTQFVRRGSNTSHAGLTPTSIQSMPFNLRRSRRLKATEGTMLQSLENKREERRPVEWVVAICNG